MSYLTFFNVFRSSLSWKHHIDVGAGVVDRDYRGNVGVVLFNLSKTDYEVKHGHRIAQLIVERISTPPLVEVEVRRLSRWLISYLIRYSSLLFNELTLVISIND